MKFKEFTDYSFISEPEFYEKQKKHDFNCLISIQLFKQNQEVEYEKTVYIATIDIKHQEIESLIAEIISLNYSYCGSYRETIILNNDINKPPIAPKKNE